VSIENGWLVVNEQPILWVPDEYCGLTFESTKMVDSTIVCIGGRFGSVIFLQIPDV
jgi:hypothetical protein